MGRCRGDPDVLKSRPTCPDPRSGASQQGSWDQDSRHVLAPPGPQVKLTRAPVVRVRAAELATRGQASAKSTSPSGANVPDDPFLLTPGQSKDFPVEISSSREPSPVESTSSSWINLDLDNSRPRGSGGNGTCNEMSMKEKLIQLEKTVAFLQAQLQAPLQLVELVKGGVG